MRIPLVVGILMLVIVIVAFLTGDSELDPADDIAETTPTSEPEATTTPVTTIDAAEDEDPREVLVDLMQDPDRPNPELVYNYLPRRFQVIDYQEEWVDSIAPVRSPGHFSSSDEFDVEEYDGYRLVRSRDNWVLRWVFVVEDGEWRFDPGDRRLLMVSALYQQGAEGGFNYGMAMPDDYQARSRSDPDDGIIAPLIRGRMEGVGVHEEGVDVSMVWEVEPGRDGPDRLIESHALSDIVIPVDSIEWSAGDASGGVEIRWTDGGFEDGELRLHGWPDEDMAQAAVDEYGTYAMLRYGATLRLLDVPEDVDEIRLHVNEVIVGPFGEDGPVLDGQRITYTWEFTFPAETTDPVMIGEPPDPHEPPERNDPVALADQPESADVR